MIMKIDSCKQYMCPKTAAKEKPNGCLGNKCAAFRLFGTHFLVKNGKKTHELMYFCGLTKKPRLIEEQYQFPMHGKETDYWRAYKGDPEFDAEYGI